MLAPGHQLGRQIHLDFLELLPGFIANNSPVSSGALDGFPFVQSHGQRSLFVVISLHCEQVLARLANNSGVRWKDCTTAWIKGISGELDLTSAFRDLADGVDGFAVNSK